jgi:hypothetical protein
MREKGKGKEGDLTTKERDRGKLRTENPAWVQMEGHLELPSPQVNGSVAAASCCKRSLSHDHVLPRKAMEMVFRCHLNDVK